MDNAYQWVPFYEALADTLNIKHSAPSQFTGNPALGSRKLFIADVNEIWKLANGFYTCIKKTEPPMSGRL